ncbi:flavin reductase (DIM6/NTAB) family NADH-FMN oxidoreductase RutF [Prauserella sediminis]|uniref:Flavin reductase (DIM6/NTAB) family NADH-FMN oxidoreductase RutF n=1 Tax=Prauserella sediminis TaxID=577680 RepID=A0A839XTY4_9PSEU|nr:flavin reductase (DIM6/NTAB) family NADH-FMN oxidoreductase RutF [Prauserella sediminis]
MVTTVVDENPHGCAANAVMSVSLDPPLMMVCLARTSSTHPRVSTSGRFAINVLPDSPSGRDICGVFAGKGAEKFAEIGHFPGLTGAPVLTDALGWLECVTERSDDLGDHTAFVGRVVAVGRRDGRPLIFHRGQLQSLAEDDREL